MILLMAKKLIDLEFVSWFRIYKPGNYILTKENAYLRILRRLGEYINGVTLARQNINRLKPQFLVEITGDVLDIGGFDGIFKNYYKNGKYLNVDIIDGPQIDLVADLANMKEIESNTIGGIICVSVIEHTLNPESAIREIYRCLKPGGKAFVSSPWLFEMHMMPNDYLRFSSYMCEKYFNAFDIIGVNYTNSYFGLLAHIAQHNIFLRLTFGLAFFLVDAVCKDTPKWATQISYILQKPLK
ncbi:methyltransferase domain-containing protein [Candidatus Kuenenia stuttgartensis]|nr:methyltransferase domain-containing protein [Candidatus Kuenenia stuttgartiensis]